MLRYPSTEKDFLIRRNNLNERVHDEELDEVREFVPRGSALPAEQELMTLYIEKLLGSLPLLHAKYI